MGGGRSDRLAIAALVLVCLLRKADSQSECRCFRVACLATQVLKQLVFVALSTAACNYKLCVLA